MKEVSIQGANEWESREESKFFISNSYFHRNAQLFLKNYADEKSSVEEAINQSLKVKHKIQLKNGRLYRRLTAGSVNVSLKKSFNRIEGIKFEVEYKEGVIFDSPKIGGFDFALFDETLNLYNFHNFCFGRNAVIDGFERWERELGKRDEWKEIAEKNNLPRLSMRGIDLLGNKNKPTIIGEIQFGNWALAFYDMFKVLHLDNLADLDLLVYITATGDLQEFLSEGIVNYDSTLEIITKYSSILKVPIWLIGIDIED